MILQGFSPATAVAKKPLSGYNVTYFLNAFFRTGKYRPDSLNHRPRGRFSATGPGSFGCDLKGGKAHGAARGGGFSPPAAGRGKLYRKGLLDGNF